MELALDSDFRDYYDHWFDLVGVEATGAVLKRQTRQGLSKREQFTLFEKIGFRVPLHGCVSDVAPKAIPSWLVVYYDEMAHCGEGKRLWRRPDFALEYVPNLYCSVFVPSTDEPASHAISKRLLAVGNRMWWLRYESNNWMSNHAENVEVAVVGEALPRQQYAAEAGLDFSHLSEYPLFAIDFVEAKDGQMMAIDFNSAPGLKGTGMEDVLPSKEVVDSIRAYLLSKLLGTCSIPVPGFNFHHGEVEPIG